MNSISNHNPPRTDLVIFGAGGMLANSLQQVINELPSELRCRFLTEAEVDLTNASRVGFVLKSIQPQWVINLAAFTNVDTAESQRSAAFQINATALNPLARLCRHLQIRLLHLSTDYVFGNTSTQPPTTGWREHDPVGPLNAYGASKLLGEEAIRQAACPHIILRTSWLFAPHGKNFVRQITQRLQNGESLKIINDQVGCPTNCSDLAQTILQLTTTDLQGTFHATNAGPSATWYDLACHIRDILNLPADRIQPCTTSQFPTPAVRPAFSALDCTKLNTALPHHPIQQNDWRTAVQDVVQQLTTTADAPTQPDREIEAKIVVKTKQLTPTR